MVDRRADFIPHRNFLSQTPCYAQSLPLQKEKKTLRNMCAQYQRRLKKSIEKYRYVLLEPVASVRRY